MDAAHLHQVLIFRVDQPVVVNPQTLVSPHPHHLRRLVETIGSRQTKAVRDPRQISQIEDVVELGGGGREVLDHFLVELQGARGDGVDHVADVFREGLHVAAQDGRVDLAQGFFRREGDVEDREEGDEARIDLVPPATSLK